MSISEYQPAKRLRPQNFDTSLPIRSSAINPLTSVALENLEQEDLSTQISHLQKRRTSLVAKIREQESKINSLSQRLLNPSSSSSSSSSSSNDRIKQKLKSKQNSLKKMKRKNDNLAKQIDRLRSKETAILAENLTSSPSAPTHSQQTFPSSSSSSTSGNTSYQAEQTIDLCTNLPIQNNVEDLSDEQKFKLFELKALEGDVQAHFDIGLCYLNGKGTEKNFEKAFTYFTKGADRAQFVVRGESGEAHIRGIRARALKLVTRPELVAAFEIFKGAAQSGDVIATLLLGLCLELGYGTVQDNTLALSFYQTAAEKGNAKAHYRLGLCHHHGRGTIVSDKAAFEAYKVSAEMGHVDAQHELGRCYKYGKGTKPDQEEALNWFKIAAENGSDRAQSMLRIISFEQKSKR